MPEDRDWSVFHAEGPTYLLLGSFILSMLGVIIAAIVVVTGALH